MTVSGTGEAGASGRAWRAALIVASVALLAVLAVVAFIAFTFHPDDYRGLFIESVEQETGRTFEVEGELGLELFPCCALTFGKAQLGNPAGFPAGTFARVDSAEARLRILPLLLRREIVIGRIRLTGLWLDLRRLSNGQSNWSATPVPLAEDHDRSAPPSEPGPNFTITAIEVDDGRIDFDDREADRTFTVRDLDVRTGEFAFHDGLVVTDPELSATVSSPDLRIKELPFGAAAKRFEISPGHRIYELVDLQLRADSTRINGGVRITDGDQPSFDFDLKADRVDLDRYRDPAERTAPTTGSPAATTTTHELITELMADTDLLLDGRLEINELKAAHLTFTSVEFLIASGSGPMTLSLEATGPGGRFELDGEGRIGGRNPRLAGELKIEGLDLRSWMKALDVKPETADDNVLRSLAGSLHWTLTPSHLALDQLAVQLDELAIAGSVALKDLASPSLEFDVSVDRLELDRYLLPPAPEDPSSATREELEASELPVEALRALELEGRLRADRLLLQDLTFDNVDADVAIHAGRVRIDPLRAGLYDGIIETRLNLDTNGDLPTLMLRQKLTGIQLGPALRARYDSNVLEGALSFSLEGMSAGHSSRELVRGLTGEFEFNVADGVYRGTDLVFEIERAQALFSGQAAPKKSKHEQTPIHTLKASGKVADGIANAQAISIDTPFLKVTGRGKLNLLTFDINLRLDAEVLDEEGAVPRGALADLLGNVVPLRIKGPVEDPTVTPKFDDMLKRRVEDTLLRLLGGEKGDS